MVTRRTHAALQRERDEINGHLQVSLSTIARLEQQAKDQEKWIDRLTSELAGLRTDFMRTVDRVGQMTPAQMSRSLFEEDPFREQQGKDEFLTPDPESEEPVDVDAIVKILDEPKSAPETVA